ncbi:MAG: PQQ-dependent sugar dehydrogenase [Deinococcota bacterium]
MKRTTTRTQGIDSSYGTGGALQRAWRILLIALVVGPGYLSAQDSRPTGDVVTEVIASGFKTPYGIAVIGEEEFLVSEREGGLFHYESSELSRVPGFPDLIVCESGPLSLGRLMDVSLHPRFGDNRLVYLSYSTEAALNVA